MVTLILGMLSNHDLFNYGVTSKTSLESTEFIWRTRYQAMESRIQSIIQKTKLNSKILENMDFEIVRGMTWYKTYTHTLYYVIFKGMNNMFNLIHHNVSKVAGIDDFLNMVNDNFDIMKKHKKFEKFLEAVRDKMERFMFGSCQERSLANKYFPLFFPDEYMTLLQDIEDQNKLDEQEEQEEEEDEEQEDNEQEEEQEFEQEFEQEEEEQEEDNYE